MSRVSSVNVEDISYHRNGVGGEGFYAIIFTAPEPEYPGKFVASIFIDDEELYTKAYINPRCSVFNICLFDNHGVEFGANSWRGDEFFYALRPAIQEYSSSFEKDRAIGKWPR